LTIRPKLIMRVSVECSRMRREGKGKFLVFTARCSAYARTIPWQDVCVSVRPSVTRRYCIATSKYMIKFFSPSGSYTILVFPQYNTIQYNTIQYNTIQYNTIQYNTIQYNTIQINFLHALRVNSQANLERCDGAKNSYE